MLTAHDRVECTGIQLAAEVVLPQASVQAASDVVCELNPEAMMRELEGDTVLDVSVFGNEMAINVEGSVVPRGAFVCRCVYLSQRREQQRYQGSLGHTSLRAP